MGSRRTFLQGAAAATALGFGARYSLAAPATHDRRFVLVLLRGALDGLAAVPSYGDPHYAQLRGSIAIAPPGAPRGALRLDNTFGLHPALTFLHESYIAKELLVIHAAATPYRERSHFDGQDVLETGLTVAHAAQSGWLNRALAALPRDTAQKEVAVALGQTVPLVLRGPSAVASWSPSTLPGIDDDTLQRIADRYARDPVLGHRLADALATDAIAMAAMSDTGVAAGDSEDAANASGTVGHDSAAARGARPGGRALAGVAAYRETVRAAAAFLRRPAGPSVAVFDTLGWDTHFNEGGADGQLSARLSVLDSALRLFRQSMAESWSRTAVLLVTEFGRTAAVNGTRGTDHGTGAAAFLLGGAVQGGRMLADWPGLSADALFQGRDLKATLDLRLVTKSVLHDHLRIDSRALDDAVFPGTGNRYLSGLIRA
ncbi:MAG TPA: DUF1501 domain-containing protein [Steroidobacteraceae bacterium]|nr:DUF1501 domain-containing protein [Steroidobacteraceae bacterium]